jgi:hypothetical protein
MIRPEATGSVDEATLITSSADVFTRSVMTVVGDKQGSVVQRRYPLRQQYHVNGSLEIIDTQSGMHALFFERDVDGEPNQREVVRAVFLANDPRVVGTERALSHAEIAHLINAIYEPNLSMGVELSDQEIAEMANRQLELAREAEGLAGEVQVSTAVDDAKSVLKKAGSFRPFDLE